MAPNPLTPRSKRVLELAQEVSLSWGRDYVGTEHLLMGLMLEGEGLACDALTRLGVTVQALEEGFEAFRTKPRVIATLEEVADALVKRATNGDLRACRLLLDAVGE